MGDVIDIFSKKIIRENSNPTKPKNIQNDKNSFDKQASRNKTNQERLRKEREQSNKNVIKSYRIK